MPSLAASSDDRPTFQSDRPFQLWRYEVGHRLLLLRSVKDDDHTTRVDVLFLDVAHVELPTSFTGLVIRHRPSDPYRLTGDGWHGEVHAAKVLHAEDDGEYFEDGPFEHAFLPRTR